MNQLESNQGRRQDAEQGKTVADEVARIRAGAAEQRKKTIRRPTLEEHTEMAAVLADFQQALASLGFLEKYPWRSEESRMLRELYTAIDNCRYRLDLTCIEDNPGDCAPYFEGKESW
jgi:hypothetical protein